MAEEILSKEDVKRMMLMRFAIEETDYEYIESALSIMYEYGYKEGLEHAAKEAGRQFADILGAEGEIAEAIEGVADIEWGQEG